MWLYSFLLDLLHLLTQQNLKLLLELFIVSLELLFFAQEFLIPGVCQLIELIRTEFQLEQVLLILAFNAVQLVLERAETRFEVCILLDLGGQVGL